MGHLALSSAGGKGKNQQRTAPPTSIMAGIFAKQAASLLVRKCTHQLDTSR